MKSETKKISGTFTYITFIDQSSKEIALRHFSSIDLKEDKR